MQPSQELNRSGGPSSNHTNAAFALKQYIQSITCWIGYTSLFYVPYN